MQKGAQAEAKTLGINLIWQGSATEYSPQSQLPFVDAVLAQQPDALILVPTDPVAMQASVDKAIAQGIPVICVDTTVTDQSKLTAFITGDNKDGGTKAADELAKQIGEKGKIFIMSGSPTTTTDVQRDEGFKAEIAKFPNIQIVGEDYSGSQPAKATSIINTILLKYPDLAGIYAIDGTSTLGSVAALQNSNAVGKVKLIGYDAYPDEVAALKKGIVSALVAQDPAKEATLALQDAVAAISGTGGIEKNVVIPNVVMTQDNLSSTEQYTYSQ